MEVLYAFLSVLVALVALLGLKIRKNRREHRAFVDSAHLALARSFGPLPLPVLTVSYTYSFPSFLLDFPTRESHQAAADSGAVSRFMAEIQQLCAHCGQKDNPFDARRAVSCSDPEHRHALEQWAAKERASLRARGHDVGDA